MPLNRNVLLRIKTIDACLKRRHRLWTLENLRQACEDALYEFEGVSTISIRSIQRDIELMRSDKLGYNAPIIVTDRKYYSYEDPDYSIAQLPLTKEDLAELNSAVDIINHYRSFRDIAGLEETITRIQDQIQSQETHRQVVFLETNDQLRGLEFLSPLYDSIIKHEPIKVHYHSFRSEKDVRFRISPYLLKEYNNRWFLLGYVEKHQTIQTLALDRILKVEIDPQGAYVPNTFFDPDTYLDEMVGVTRDLSSEKEVVTLWIDAEQAPYVLTKPIHRSQQLVTTAEDGSIIVSLQLIVNLELQRVILGYGSHIEVIAPRYLRQHIARHILIACTRYTE